MKKIVSLILIFSLAVTSAVPTLAQGREIEDKNYYRDLFLLSSLTAKKSVSPWDDSQKTNVDWVYPYVRDVFDDEIRLIRYTESLPNGFDSFANKLPEIFDFLLKADSSNPKIPPLVKYLANKTSIFDALSEVMKILIIKARLGYEINNGVLEDLKKGVQILSLFERKIPEVLKVYDELGPVSTSMKKAKPWLSAVLKEAAAQKDYFNYIENRALLATNVSVLSGLGLIGLAAIRDWFFKETPNLHKRKETPKKPSQNADLGRREQTKSEEVKDLFRKDIPKAPGINMNKEFIVPLMPSTVPQEVNEMETERLLEEQEQILTEEWLQDQCWVRAGAPFKKGGSRDLAFYQAVKQAMAAEGFQFDTANWEIFLNEQWELFKISRHPPTKGTKKPRPARAARPVAPDASDDKGKEEASESVEN